MLSNKNFSAFLFFSLIVFISCGDSDEKKTKAPLRDYNNPAVRLTVAEKVLGSKAKITFWGNFNKNDKEELIAGSEVNTKDEWGIRFTSIDVNSEQPEILFETGLLEGSIEGSRIEKLNISSKNYELLYYNSGDFFMGSGGGEVISYIIDFHEKEIYYAHLVADNKKVSLYLSDNFETDDIRQFFLNTFKRDFPSLVLVQQDIEYDN